MLIKILALAMMAAHPGGDGRHETKRAQAAAPGEVLRSPLALADGIEVILIDLNLPPNAELPRHFHPGEEFILLMEGTVTHREAGKSPRIMKAGDGLVIPPFAIHSPVVGPEGARAVVFRVHIQDMPERFMVDVPLDAE